MLTRCLNGLVLIPAFAWAVDVDHIVPGGPGPDFPTADSYYPAQSARIGEEGMATVHVCTDMKGNLTKEPSIAESSGSESLDAGALQLAKVGSGHYKPATENGKPIPSCFGYRIKFVHRQNRTPNTAAPSTPPPFVGGNHGGRDISSEVATTSAPDLTGQQHSADEVAFLHQAFLLCGPASLEIQVSCAEAAYVRSHHKTSPELSLFEEIAADPLESVLRGERSSPQESLYISGMLSDVERALRSGTSLGVIEEQIKQANERFAQRRGDVERGREEPATQQAAQQEHAERDRQSPLERFSRIMGAVATAPPGSGFASAVGAGALAGANAGTRTVSPVPISPTTSTQPAGFFVREEVSGLNKICYYNQFGSTEAFTISGTQLCPLTYSGR